MKVCRSLGIVAIVTVTACSSGPATGPNSTPPTYRPLPVPDGPFTLRYAFDEAIRSDTISDSSGNGHDGRVIAQNGGTVGRVTGRGGKGHGAEFPDLCGKPGCTQPTVVIEAAESQTLNPGRKPFTFGASVRMSRLTPGANVIQKGNFTDRVQWKLQVDRGFPSCVIRKADRQGLVRSPQVLRTGRWYDLSCRKSGGHLTLAVDGVVRARKAIGLGQIRNDAPVHIGAKGAGAANNDQFHGVLDDVFIHVER